MRTISVTVLVIAAALAGCAGSDSLDTQAVSASLRSHAADELGDEAELYAIQGLELTESTSSEETDGCGSFSADTKHGDGKAPIWSYMYATEAGRLAVVITDQAGKVQCTQTMDQDMSAAMAAMSPLDEWRVEAPEAASIIADHVEGFPDSVQDSPVVMELMNATGGPVWVFSAFSLSGTDMRSWTVDAMNGEFRNGTPGVAGSVAPPEGGTADGQTTGTFALTTIVPAEFRLPAAHATLEFSVDMDDPAADAGVPYTARLIWPDGTEEDHSVTDGQVVELTNPGRGAYELRAFPPVGGTASYTVTYCAYSGVHCDDGGTDSMARAVLPFA